MVKHVERNFAGRALKLEAGRLAKQAAGSCLLQFGETVVLATVTVSDNVSTLPFFPLTVEYREKAYAAGNLAGGVGLLAVFDGQRKERQGRDVVRHRDGGEHDRLPELQEAGARGLFGQAARLELQRAAREVAFYVFHHIACLVPFQPDLVCESVGRISPCWSTPLEALNENGWNGTRAQRNPRA